MENFIIRYKQFSDNLHGDDVYLTNTAYQLILPLYDEFKAMSYQDRIDVHTKLSAIVNDVHDLSAISFLIIEATVEVFPELKASILASKGKVRK